MCRRLPVVAITLALLGAAPATAAAAPALSGTFDVSDTPAKLAAGTDGNMWVVVGGAKVARILPDGTVKEFDLTGVNGAKGITSGPDGNLWVTASNKVVKVPPADPSLQVATPLADITDARAITTGPDGNLWTASGDKVLKIPPADPASATPFTVTGMGARDIASAGGLLWVVDFAQGQIVSLTPTGTQKAYPVGGNPQGIGAGPNGQVLYANPGVVPQQVGRLVAGGTPLTSDRPLADPFGVALGADGAYWVAEFAAGDLARVTTDGVVTTLGGLPKNDPREVAAGPGNTLWVSLELSKKVAKVTGVDPPPVVTPPVTTPPVVTPPADTTAPVVTGLRVRPQRFRAGTGRLARLAASSPPANVTLTLSEAATVTFGAERLTAGVRVRGRCVAPTRTRRPTKRTRCTRAVATGGTVGLALPQGASTLAFSGRLARRLGAGSYRLLATPRDAAGNTAAPKRAAFTVLPPKRRR